MVLSPSLFLVLLVVALLAVFRSERCIRVLREVDEEAGRLSDAFVSTIRRGRRRCLDVGIEMIRSRDSDSDASIPGITRVAVSAILLSGVALLVLASEAALLLMTLAGMLHEPLPLPPWAPAPSTIVAVGSVAAAAFWGLVLMDLHGVTRLEDWPRAKWFRWTAWGAVALLSVLFVGAAEFRHVVTAAALEGRQIGLWADTLSRLVFLAAAAISAVTAAVAGIGFLRLCPLLLALVLVVPPLLALTAAGWVVGALGALSGPVTRIASRVIESVSWGEVEQDETSSRRRGPTTGDRSSRIVPGMPDRASSNGDRVRRGGHPDRPSSGVTGR